MKEHVCDECGKAFSKINNLWRHEKSVHKKIKDAKCDLCSFSATSESEVQKHIRNRAELPLRRSAHVETLLTDWREDIARHAPDKELRNCKIINTFYLRVYSNDS